MPRTRILLYSDGWAFSGAERYLLDLAQGLSKDRFEVSAVCAVDAAVDGLAAEFARSVETVHRLPRIEKLSDRKALARVLRFFLARRPPVIHWNLADPRSCNGAMVAATMACLSGFVTTEHLPQSPFDDRPLPFRHRLAARRTRVTIVNCEQHREVVESRPQRHGKVVVIPNGVSDPGPTTPARRAEARRKLGTVDDHAFLIGWVGRADPQKNLNLFIEGLARVLPARTRAHAVVLGDGQDLEAARAKIETLGHSARVRFLGHRPDARDLLHGLDVLVNTSHYEGMPFSILEAMAAGTPAVGPRIPGVRELIADRASGFLFNPGDADHLGQLLIDAAGAKELLTSFGHVARERARTLFGLDLMCRRTAEIYDEIAHGREL